MVGFEVGADVQLLVDADDQEDGEADEDADFILEPLYLKVKIPTLVTELSLEDFA